MPHIVLAEGLSNEMIQFTDRISKQEANLDANIYSPTKTTDVEAANTAYESAMNDAISNLTQAREDHDTACS